MQGTLDHLEYIDEGYGFVGLGPVHNPLGERPPPVLTMQQAAGCVDAAYDYVVGLPAERRVGVSVVGV